MAALCRHRQWLARRVERTWTWNTDTEMHAMQLAKGNLERNRSRRHMPGAM